MASRGACFYQSLFLAGWQTAWHHSVLIRDTMHFTTLFSENWSEGQTHGDCVSLSRCVEANHGCASPLTSMICLWFAQQPHTVSFLSSTNFGFLQVSQWEQLDWLVRCELLFFSSPKNPVSAASFLPLPRVWMYFYLKSCQRCAKVLVFVDAHVVCLECFRIG